MTQLYWAIPLGSTESILQLNGSTTNDVVSQFLSSTLSPCGILSQSASSAIPEFKVFSMATASQQSLQDQQQQLDVKHATSASTSATQQIQIEERRIKPMRDATASTCASEALEPQAPAKKTVKPSKLKESPRLLRQTKNEALPSEPASSLTDGGAEKADARKLQAKKKKKKPAKPASTEVITVLTPSSSLCVVTPTIDFDATEIRRWGAALVAQNTQVSELTNIIQELLQSSTTPTSPTTPPRTVPTPIPPTSPYMQPSGGERCNSPYDRNPKSMANKFSPQIIHSSDPLQPQVSPRIPQTNPSSSSYSQSTSQQMTLLSSPGRRPQSMVSTNLVLPESSRHRQVPIVPPLSLKSLSNTPQLLGSPGSTVRFASTSGTTLSPNSSSAGFHPTMGVSMTDRSATRPAPRNTLVSSVVPHSSRRMATRRQLPIIYPESERGVARTRSRPIETKQPATSPLPPGNHNLVSNTKQQVTVTQPPQLIGPSRSFSVPPSTSKESNNATLIAQNDSMPLSSNITGSHAWSLWQALHSRHQQLSSGGAPAHQQQQQQHDDQFIVNKLTPRGPLSSKEDVKKCSAQQMQEKLISSTVERSTSKSIISREFGSAKASSALRRDNGGLEPSLMHIQQQSPLKEQQRQQQQHHQTSPYHEHRQYRQPTTGAYLTQQQPQQQSRVLRFTSPVPPTEFLLHPSKQRETSNSRGGGCESITDQNNAGKDLQHSTLPSTSNILNSNPQMPSLFDRPRLVKATSSVSSSFSRHCALSPSNAPINGTVSLIRPTSGSLCMSPLSRSNQPFDDVSSPLNHDKHQHDFLKSFKRASSPTHLEYTTTGFLRQNSPKATVENSLPAIRSNFGMTQQQHPAGGSPPQFTHHHSSVLHKQRHITSPPELLKSNSRTMDLSTAIKQQSSEQSIDLTPMSPKRSQTSHVMTPHPRVMAPVSTASRITPPTQIPSRGLIGSQRGNPSKESNTHGTSVDGNVLAGQSLLPRTPSGGNFGAMPPSWAVARTHPSYLDHLASDATTLHLNSFPVRPQHLQRSQTPPSRPKHEHSHHGSKMAQIRSPSTPPPPSFPSLQPTEDNNGLKTSRSQRNRKISGTRKGSARHRQATKTQTPGLRAKREKGSSTAGGKVSVAARGHRPEKCTTDILALNPNVSSS